MDSINNRPASRDAGINFYELKTQLADLGFVKPELVDRLREIVLSDRSQFSIQHREVFERLALDSWFNLYRQDADGPIMLDHYDTALYQQGTMNISYRAFEPDIPKEMACQVLAKQLAQQLPESMTIPWTLDKVSAVAYLTENNPQQIDFFNQLNCNNMNTQNLDFLKKSLLNLGFGEQVNEALEKNINKKVPEFNLMAKHEFNQQKVDYNLHFKAGDNQDMYFFNKFDATMNKGKEKEMNQTFYINKGNGITAKEAFNLMEGRAVHKQLFNKDGEKYQAWLQLDNDNLTQNGNKEIKRFSENYGFKLEDVLAGKGIKELNTPEGTENLFRSLKKGNTQQITVERNGEEKKYFIAASPQFKTVDLFDHQQKKIKREELLNPEQKQSSSQKQNNNQKQGKQQKEELPGKKQGSKRKMTV
ncbi:hypothetical protein KXD93_30120 [Mucilaginibacter sp. BJC16-A38]|uniref:hypothetical protein n=1 Tax=Mucilaginibacter phenanthrenivorans TaxID=1234842 RepID=UPI00215785C3|nr:hypothetical protein [Mucilaginibacter phenanthrenivorans]MCR8561949.1 hypothetical protein [Mucilaginibacter phenanthrenivorans]